MPLQRVAEEGEKGDAAGRLQRPRLEAAIVLEDARLLALNKPSRRGAATAAAGSAMIETPRALRPGQTLEPAHRLDRDTSGWLIIAK